MSGSWAQRAAASLLPLSVEKENLKRALKEWLYTGDMYDLEKPIEVCQLCAHPDIRFQFEVANKHTGHALLVGSECITKFGILALEQDGTVLTREETRKKVARDRTKLVTEAKRKSVIQSLVQRAAADTRFNIDSFIVYLQNRGAFTPNQLAFLLWRLDEHGIPYRKSYLKIVIRRDHEKAQLLSMEDWKVRKLWPSMSQSQRRFYVTNTPTTPQSVDPPD